MKLQSISDNTKFLLKDTFSFKINYQILIKNHDTCVINKIKTNKKYNGCIKLYIKFDDTEMYLTDYILNNEYIELKINKHLKNIKDKNFKIVIKNEDDENIEIEKGYVFIHL